MNTTKTILLCATMAVAAGCATTPTGGKQDAERKWLSKTVRRELAEARKRNMVDTGWVLVQDANSGEILCAEMLSSGSGSASGVPWRGEVIELGGFVLPFLASEAIDAGIATNGAVFDVSSETVGGVTMRDIPYGRDALSLSEIIKWSSTRGGANIALELGPERVEDGLMAFGFALDGSAAEKGRPDARLAWYGAGRGVLANGLSLISAFSAIANGGTLRAAWGCGTNREQQFFGKSVSEPKTCEAVRDLLRGATHSDGTARAASVHELDVGGKTATIQIKDGLVYSHRFRSMFAGFFETNERMWTILVVFEVPDTAKRKDAGILVAPVFARIASCIRDFVSNPTVQPL